MAVIAIIGAGPGMGGAIARTFGTQGFEVALVSRTLENGNALAATLAAEGITAKAFTANVLDADSVSSAMQEIVETMGPIDVLEYSPADGTLPRNSPLEVTAAGAQLQFDYYVGGAIAAIQAVLPAMLARKSGTIITTTGGSAVEPNALMGDVALASAALRNWTLSLHVAAAEHGVQAAYIGINAWLGNQPGAEPSLVAPLYWQAHTDHSISELLFKPSA